LLSDHRIVNTIRIVKTAGREVARGFTVRRQGSCQGIGDTIVQWRSHRGNDKFAKTADDVSQKTFHGASGAVNGKPKGIAGGV
jgi:hypothetical protein